MRTTLLALFLVLCAGANAATPAFPTAEGSGKFVTGGRGGDVYHVTNLNGDKSPGSLARGVTTTPDAGRTIVFDVSGTIELSEPLKINKDNLTVAGQTAPGQGICIKGRVQVGGNNIVLRHLHIRPWEKTGDGDALNLAGNNIIVDHCSVSWSADEVLSTSAREVYNITVQWTYIYEGLDRSWHVEQGKLLNHSMGSLLTSIHDGAILSFHHNLYAHNRTRNPKVTSSKEGCTTYLDFRNNVVYDWGSLAGYSTDKTHWTTYLNYVNNFLVAGASSRNKGQAFDGKSTTCNIYAAGNLIDAEVSSKKINAKDTGWAMITGTYNKLKAPFEAPEVKTTPAAEAFESVLTRGGAFYWDRDACDVRVTGDVRNKTGKVINLPEDVGGYPVIAVQHRQKDWDTDGDGMPDAWEMKNGLDPKDPSDGNRLTPGGYTCLEAYLCSLVGEEIAVR